MPGPVLTLVKWSGLSKVRMQALRHSLAVLGMQTDFQFAKIIREFFVLIPKLPFVSGRKMNCPGDQITIKEARIGRLDRWILERIIFLKIILQCDRVDVPDGSLGWLSLGMALHEGANPRLYSTVLR